jgi:hypothetical protein
MQLPFSREDFFDLFAAYNGALWPAVVALWVASVLAAVWMLSSRRSHDRWLSGLLVIQWAWSAVAYHVVFFTRINPAAWLFAAIFLLQATVFFWSGVIRGHLAFMASRTVWTKIGWFLVVYALLYPAINAVEHGNILSIPTFGLPCPTTIFTAGLLLLAMPHSRIFSIVPIVWSVIGGSAAFLLGVSADYALPVAGAALAVFELQKSRTSAAKVVLPLHRPVVRWVMVRKTLLVCGILAAVLYVAMTIFVGLLWEDYSSTAQTISELSAIGAPTRPLWMLLGTVYGVLMVGFGWIVWKSSPPNRALRVVGALLMVQAVFGFFWPPMHQRPVLAAGGGTLTDTLHIVWTIVTSLFFMFALGFGAAAFGKRFRIYSIATMVIVFACGAWTGTYASRLQANLPTPGAGVWERMNTTAFMVWIAVLAIALLRTRDPTVVTGRKDAVAA